MAVLTFIRTYLKSLLMYGIVVSGLAALAEWSSFAGMVYGLQLHYLPASVLAFLVGTTVNALLSRALAFSSRGRSGWQETLLIYLTSALAFMLNAGAMVVAIEWLGMHVMIAKVLGTAAAFVINFACRQFFIFSAVPRWK